MLMFLHPQELNTVIYQYQLEQITEADPAITLQAIEAAVQEAKSYISPNNKKEWADGRLRYDADAAFATTGSQRNALLLEHTKTIALWYIVRLCNADVMHEHIKERYDRAITWLKALNKGDITLNLPLLAPQQANEASAQKPWGFGSRSKFNHQ